MEYERDDLHEMFRKITNIVQPDHSYDREYPIRKDELETTWCRADSSTWALCGPRRYNGNKAKIAFDIGYMNKKSIERILCIINHELTHITELSHKPVFWDTVVEHAKIIIDNKAEVETILGQRFDTEEFIEEVVTEPNYSMTDGRTETPEERQEKMRAKLEGYRPKLRL